MKTIQMSLDDHLLNQVDQTIKNLKITRSAYIRESIRHYLKQTEIKTMEKRHQEGYEKFPVEENEFDFIDVE